MQRRIAGFSALIVHYEMFGFLIHYCKQRNYSLTIYCDFRYENGYIDFYNQIFQYPLLSFENLWGNFEHEINHYDAIVLFTDDDEEYQIHNHRLLQRTLMIEHSIFRKRTDIPHAFSTRPFDFSVFQEARIKYPEFAKYTEPSSCIWTLPTYPLFSPFQKTPLAQLSRQTTVCILGGYAEYHLELIHRLRPMKNTDPKIKLIAISRHMERKKFDGLDKNKFDLEVHHNMHIHSLFETLKKVDFIITDVSKDNEYKLEKTAMSGCIPLAFSMLIPLIISKQTNSQYQFQNVVEFDKTSRDPIRLDPPTPEKIHEECQTLVAKNMRLFDQTFRTIFMANQVIDGLSNLIK